MVIRNRWVGVGLICVIAAAACSGKSTSTRRAVSTTTSFPNIAPTHQPLARCTAPTQDRRAIQYVTRVSSNPAHTRLDLYTTASMRCAPLFAFVHGGGYCCGDKRNDISPVAKWLNARGYAVASINYRLTQGRDHVRYPAFNDDVAAAVAWLRIHGASVGIDPDRIVLGGHSTGGQIAAMVGVDGRYLERVGEHLNSLRCVALLDGSGFDFTDAAAHGNDGVRRLYSTVFGNAAAIAEASPVKRVAKGRGIAPFLIVERKGDNPRKIIDQEVLVTALRQVGVAVTTIDASSIGHGQVVTNIGKPNDRVMTNAFFAFLASCAQPRDIRAHTTSAAETSTSARFAPTTITTANPKSGPDPTVSSTPPAAPNTTAQNAQAPATTSPQGCVPPSANPTFNVTFGPANLDIYPTSQRCDAPIALFVHGGGYCCGNKSQISSRTIQWFNAQGYTLVSTDYRLGVQYPTFDNDVAQAISWLRQHATSYGADASHLVLMGHSTGGAMVGEIGTTPAILASAGLTLSAIDCVAVLDGSALDIEDLFNNPPSAATVATLKKAYGNDPAVWAQASAMRNANDGSAVQRFLVVERGTQATTQRRFVNALRSHGISASTIDASSIGHGQVINNIGATTDTVMSAPLSSFLTQCGP